MGSSPPPVALLVPAYRAARYLPRLVADLRAQTRPFAEWHCYDDASGDDTAKAAKELGFSVQEAAANGGPSRARNALAEATEAPWIHFHDADDALAPDYLESALVATGDDCDVIICDSVWELEDSREAIIHWQYRQNDYDADPLTYPITHPVGVISALIRRSTFLSVGGFDETMTCWEDADLFVRLAERGARFRFLEKTLVTSLRHDRGISRDQRHCNRCRLQFLQGYAKRFSSSARPAIAAEAEKLIPRFLAVGERSTAEAALRLCHELGARPPTTRSPVLRLLKRFMPTLTLMRWQNRFRTRGPAKA